MHSSPRHMIYAALLRLHPRHERHHHLHRGDRGDDGAENLGRDADRSSRIVADRAVHHRRDRRRALHHGLPDVMTEHRAAHRWRSRQRRI